MGGGDGCRYVRFDLSRFRADMAQVWGLGAQYIADCVDLEKQTLVSFGGDLESYCVGGGDVCRYVGVNVC